MTILCSVCGKEVKEELGPNMSVKYWRIHHKLKDLTPYITSSDGKTFVYTICSPNCLDKYNSVYDKAVSNVSGTGTVYKGF